VAAPGRRAVTGTLSGATPTIGAVNALLPRLRRGTAITVLALVLAGGSLAGCSGGGGGGGGNTSCGVDGCTVTFPRSGSAEVSVLGVSARLVRVDADIAQIEVAGQTVQVPVGGQTEVGGFVVRVQEVNDQQVVVKISA
jgi:hypothetical protein